jgi:general nucleoside transport system permease protein
MLDVLNIMLTPEFGFTVIRVVVPILFAALAAYIANSAGIANIAIEGMMLMAAFVGTVTSAFTQNAWIGLIAACLAGMVMAAILSYFTLILKTNNILGGIALNLFSSSFTVFPFVYHYGFQGYQCYAECALTSESHHSDFGGYSDFGADFFGS